MRKSYLNHFLNNTAKIRVTVNDNELANNTDTAESSTFILDTTAPTSPSVVVNGSTTPAALTLSASDNSSRLMKIGLESNLSDGTWKSYATSDAISLSTDPEVVYAQFKDVYGNTTSIVSAATTETPSNFMVQDVSNMNTTPATYRLFIVWKLVAEPTPGFKRYNISRSADNVTYSPLTTITERATNYYMDSTVSFDTIYYYKVTTQDNNDNISYLSTSVNGKANGAQDAGEGGGGTESTPPTISNVASSAVTTQTATITWNTDEPSNSTVEYILATGGDFTEAPTVDVATMRDTASGLGAHSVTLSGLTPRTTYYYQVKSQDPDENEAAKKDGTDGYTFTTRSGAAITANSVTASNIENSSATVEWLTDANSDSYVVYSTNSNLSGSTARGIDTDAQTHSVTLTGLTQGTKYYYYVKSTDPEENEATDKNVVGGVIQYYTFTTTQDATAPTITFNPLTGITNTTTTGTTISWTTNELAASIVNYGTTISYGSQQTNTNYNTDHVFTMASLIPATTYYFKISSTDANSNTATDDNSSHGYTFVTMSSTDTTPPEISNVSAGTPSPTSVAVTWTTDENSSSLVDFGTTVQYGTTQGNSTDATTSHSVTLSGLSPSTNYYIRVKSIDAAGNLATDDNSSNGYAFTTANSPDPGDVTAPVILNVNATPTVTANTAIITWTTDENSDSVVGYSLDNSFELEKGSTTQDTSHSITLAGLAPETTYYFSVKSRDAAGNLASDDNSESGYTFTTSSGGDSISPVISNAATSSIANTQATITWATDENSSSLVDFGTTQGTYTSTQGNYSASATSHSVTITSLTSGADYYFRVRSIDGANNQGLDDNNGEGYTFATTQDTTGPVIANITAASTMDTSTVITWTTNESATSKVEYGTTSGTYSTPTTENTNLNINHAVSLASLTANTKYYYRVISKDASNNTTTSAEQTFATLEKLSQESEVEQRETTSAASSGGGGVLIIDKTDKTAPVISNIKVGDIRADSASVSWVTNENANSFVQYGTSASYGDTYGIYNSVLSHSVNLKFLTPEKIYHYRVLGADSWGNLGSSQDQIFSTPSKTAEEIKTEKTQKQEEQKTEAEKKQEKLFQDITDLTNPESGLTKEEMFANATVAAQTAMEAIKNMYSQVSIETAGKSISTQFKNWKELGNIIPAPIMSGEPKIVTTATTAIIAWKTDKESNSLAAIARENAFNETKADPYQQVVGDVETRTLNHVVTIYDLEPDTIYHYQLRSQAEIGPMARSKDFTFQTKTETLEITNYTSQIESDQKVIFKWVTNLETDTSLKYIPYRDNKLMVEEAKTLANNAVSIIHEIAVDDFEAGVPYEIELSGKDINGKLTAKTISAFTTSKDDLPPIIYQVQTDSALSQGKTTQVQTIISWLTNEPTLSKLLYMEGIKKETEEFKEKISSGNNFSKRHVVVVTKFAPGTVYSFQIESADSGGNQSLSKIYSILTPKQKESVFQIIIKNFEKIFGWVNQMR